MANLVVLFSGSAITKGYLFKTAELEYAYRNFTDIGREEGFFVFFSVPKFVNGKIIEKGIVFRNKWVQVKNQTADYVFEKLSYGGKRKQMLKRISENFKVINNPEMSMICDNKMLTCKIFPQHSPGTFSTTRKNFRGVLEKMKSKKVVLKPLYGAQSFGVVIKNRSEVTSNDIGNQYIAQEYIDTKGGIKKIQRQNTLRLLILNGEIVFITLETAKKGDIVSGNVKALKVSENDIPMNKIKKILNNIESVFGNFYPRFYSVDFFVDKKENVFLAEINSKPGLYPSEGESRQDYNRIIRKFFRSLKPK